MKKIILPFVSILLGFVSTMFAQIPSELPNPDDNEPIDFTNTADIILYIVLPIILLLLVLYRFRNKKNK